MNVAAIDCGKGILKIGPEFWVVADLGQDGVIRARYLHIFCVEGW
jgi:hypothetical protein